MRVIRDLTVVSIVINMVEYVLSFKEISSGEAIHTDGQRHLLIAAIRDLNFGVRDKMPISGVQVTTEKNDMRLVTRKMARWHFSHSGKGEPEKETRRINKHGKHVRRISYNYTKRRPKILLFSTPNWSQESDFGIKAVDEPDYIDGESDKRTPRKKRLQNALERDDPDYNKLLMRESNAAIPRHRRFRNILHSSNRKYKHNSDTHGKTNIKFFSTETFPSSDEDDDETDRHSRCRRKFSETSASKHLKTNSDELELETSSKKGRFPNVFTSKSPDYTKATTHTPSPAARPASGRRKIYKKELSYNFNENQPMSTSEIVQLMRYLDDYTDREKYERKIEEEEFYKQADGRQQAPKIQSSRPSPELAAGADGSMTVARGEGSPERLGSALRRLHYKATRRAHSAAARHHNNTPPKVVVMGSSTTSDKTINTSTDSAATALTSITGTDDSMDAEPEAPEPTQPSLIDDPNVPHNPPSTAPPHYHRGQSSSDIESPAYTKPQSATDVLESPRPGPARFVFDVPLPDPMAQSRRQEKPRNKTHVSHTSAASSSIQIPYDPKMDQPKSPKASQTKYETHFKFEPEPVKRRGSEGREPRVKNKQKDKEYYKDEVTKLRRQLEGTEVFTTNRRRSSAHQHSVPPPSSRRQSTAAQVHVTANPLDSAANNLPAGRTTIVVQQPSLSLDYGGCATILVRDDERRKSRVCSDHIQQLLDVTSQFTSEDLHEFDKRYGSPHHSRSQSVKAGRSRTGERQLLGLPQQRARVASMPNTGVEEEYYRLRHFSITGKGVVNRGDSLRSRRSRSNTSVASSASSTEAATRASAPCSLASSRDSSAGLSAYRVLVIGAPGVGKSSLVGQFMTSEYLHAYDTSIDDESGERSVCVLLAGEESEITFLDAPPDCAISEGCAHGYCVVYSTADRASFVDAERRLQILWAAGHTSRRAVILVGNKADLARSRAVPTDEGKNLATSYECKFIETSVGINHNVDELLVGLLTQIRLKQQHAERVRKRSGSRKNRGRARSPLESESTCAPAAPPPALSAASTPRKRTRLSASLKVRGLLGRVWARDSKSKSCENLHVL